MAETSPKRILLISASAEVNPLININQELIPATDDIVHYPLGLAYLYSVLEAAGHQVRLLFLTKHEENDCLKSIADIVNDFSPQIIGYQMLTFNRVSTCRAVESVSASHPEIIQVLGGIHATTMHRQILGKYPNVIIALAEGENTMLELAANLPDQSFDLGRIDGLAYSQNGEIKKTKPRELIKDLDSIPFPKHELFFAGQRTVGSIITTRGCPFNCSFCCLNSVSQDKVRMRSVGNIIAEIEMMLRKFPQLKTIWIQDDTFFVDNRRVIEFCDEIIRRGIKIDFACNGRMRPISALMVEKLEQANFKRIFLGLESGDNSILQRCHKGITQADAVNAFKLFSKSNIDIYAHLIVGLSGETTETIKETARFVRQLQQIKYIHNYYPYLLIVFPGTEIYELAKAAGTMTDDYWLSDKTPPFYTSENSYEKLLEFQQTLLYSVSPILALCTWRGFVTQFAILPRIIKHVFSSRANAKFFLIGALKFLLPKSSYGIIKNWYHQALSAVK